jgi:hypothetical protein
MHKIIADGLSQEMIASYKKVGINYWHCYMCEGVCEIEKNKGDMNNWQNPGLSREEVFKKYGHPSSCVCPDCLPRWKKEMGLEL